ncbi:hypothetical protein GC176_21260 [bacterium]|nr:hypothetical protein [bacterium]
MPALTVSTMPKGKIEFIDSHIPSLESGLYTVSVSQSVTTKRSAAPTVSRPYSAEHDFFIAGERFVLDPTEVVSVFPPRGNNGDHGNVIPHVILKRSTLPWERCRAGAPETEPWLALLVVHEGDPVQLSTHNVSALRSERATGSSTDGMVLPGYVAEPGDDPDARISVLSMPRSYANALIPPEQVRALTAHVRRPMNDNSEPDGLDQAVVIATRLPRPGATTTAHLVSIEHLDSRVDPVRLVSLYNWSFSCPSDEAYLVTPSVVQAIGRKTDLSIEELKAVTKIADAGEIIGAKNFQDALKRAIGKKRSDQFFVEIASSAAHTRESFKGLILNLDRQPSSPGVGSEQSGVLGQYLRLGSTILPHLTRQGDQLQTWYRGPLAPGPVEVDNPLPAQTADQLLHYNPEIGMFDATYAAAWELGRLLAITDPTINEPVALWKTRHAQHQVAQSDTKARHLPLQRGYTADELGVPKPLEGALNRLRLLHGVPFWYLIPDERMLPVESIRFFQIDAGWIRAMLDGVMSIGRVTPADLQRDRELESYWRDDTPRTGFLLRSHVVAGWPEFQIDGYRDTIEHDHFVPSQERLDIVRKDRLAPDTMICVFDGVVMTTDLHLRPETIHFGLDRLAGQPGRFRKELRNNKGEEVASTAIDDVPFRNSKNQLIVDLAKFKGMIENELGLNVGTLSPSQFALEMIEGVEKIRLRISG